MNIFSKINHYRIVKLLYTLYMAIFMFIIEINIFSPMPSNKIGIKDFLILIILGLLMEYLNYKEKKPKLILLIVLAIDLIYSAIFYWFGSSENYFVLSFMLNLIYILIHNKFNEPNIDNYHYKSLGKILNIILVLSILFYGFLTPYEVSYLFKAYIAYLISYILLLRESRRFSFKLYKKEDNIITSLYVMFIIFMFTTIGNRIAGILILGIKKFLIASMYVIATILYYTIGNLLFKIRNLVGEKNTAPTVPKSISEVMNTKELDAVYNIWFFILAYSIIIILIIILLIYIFKKFRLRTIEKDGFVEIREKVENIPFIKKRKRVSYGNNKDKNKNLIFVYYRKFLILVWKKGLYKNYMTSRQVKGMVRTEISNKDEELTILSEVYNEAKFSNHNLNEEKVKNVENAYREVKKVLK